MPMGRLKRRVAHVLHQIGHARQAALGRHLAHVGGDQGGYAFARQRRHHAPAQKAVGPGHQDATRCQ